MPADGLRGAAAPEPQYRPQLDSLRGLAVAAVLVHHFLGAQNLPWGLEYVPFGFAGATILESR